MLIKNGTIVTASDIFKADIKISDGKIAEIGLDLKADGEEVIDAAGQYVFPGGIDLHTHFDHIGMCDSFETGSLSAIAGGITTVGNFVEGSSALNLFDNLKDWKYNRTKKSYVDYVLVPVINGSYIKDAVSDMPELVKEGIHELKLFMAYRGGGLLVDDVDLYKVIKTAAENGVLCSVHCENGDVIDEIVKEWVEKGYTEVINHGYTRPCCMEAEATNRIICIAEAAGAPIRIVHVSCIDALEQIKLAQSNGRHVLAETCPHYLTKDISQLGLPDFQGAKNVCSPPLREPQHQVALWEALKKGIVTTVSSDHFPVPFEGEGVTKSLGRDVWTKIPNGCPGVEELFSVVYQKGVVEGRLTLNEFVKVTSYNAAKEYGIYPQKGCIMPGADADLVVFDPNRSRTLSVKTQHGTCDYNSYEGLEINGVITNVISRGELVVKDDEILAAPGRGKFVPGGVSSAF